MSWARVSIIIVALLATAGCPTRRSSEVCCNTAVECDEFGLDGITACEGVKVCIEGSCESPTCETSADCAAPSPYCVNTTCVAACSGDPSCVGAGAGPYCAPDGACVDCLADAQCGGATPVCDTDLHSCRACTDDSECASGICLAAEGACFDAQEAVFVTTDGTDTGECTASAPCASIAFALPKITNTRRVLRIPSTDFIEDGGVVLDRDVYVDGAGTRIRRGGTTGPILEVNSDATVILEGLRLLGVARVSMSKVTTYDVVADNLQVATQGELHFTHSTVSGGGLTCAELAIVEVVDSTADRAWIYSDSCQLTVRRSRLTTDDAAPAIRANVILPVFIENNVIGASGLDQGSFLNVGSTYGHSDAVIRFNTMIAGASGTHNMITCSIASAVMSSNLVIGRSPNAFYGTCPIDHTLVDDATGVPPGVGNSTASEAEMLPGLASEDYTPGAPARGAGNPDEMPVDDLFGNPRPMPAGSDPDIGAVEAP